MEMTNLEIDRLCYTSAVGELLYSVFETECSRY